MRRPGIISEFHLPLVARPSVPSLRPQTGAVRPGTRTRKTRKKAEPKMTVAVACSCRRGAGQGQATEKAIREFLFLVSPPRGDFLKKNPLRREFSITNFFKRWCIPSNVSFIFFKRGNPGGELYLTCKKMAFSYSKGAPVPCRQHKTRQASAGT